MLSAEVHAEHRSPELCAALRAAQLSSIGEPLWGAPCRSWLRHPLLSMALPPVGSTLSCKAQIWNSLLILFFAVFIIQYSYFVLLRCRLISCVLKFFVYSVLSISL